MNYRRADLTKGCLRSLEPEITGHPERCVIVVDNASGDGSAEEIYKTIIKNQWGDWVQLICSPVNAGFAAGNNLAFKAVHAEFYLLLNSDTLVKPGFIRTLLQVAALHPQAGIIGPQLQNPNGKAQISCFRYRSPISEFLASAGSGILINLFSRFEVAVPISEKAIEPQWISFACVLIRRHVIERVGMLDEGYFMYFEDIDFCRRVRQAGWRIQYEPSAKVVHLHENGLSVNSVMQARGRLPRYYYESRSRYFAKFYGGTMGLCLTNLLWTFGRIISLLREMIGTESGHLCSNETWDIWTKWLHPLRTPTI